MAPCQFMTGRNRRGCMICSHTKEEIEMYEDLVMIKNEVAALKAAIKILANAMSHPYYGPMLEEGEDES